MEEFEIKGDKGFLRLKIEQIIGYPEKTSPLGGYDIECSVLVKSLNYEVCTVIWVTTFDIYNFYQEIIECQKELKGQAIFHSYERILKLKLIYDEIGHCNIEGSVAECDGSNDYELIFELTSDQSFINDTLEQMKPIVDKYGDRNGKIRTF